MGLFDTIAGAVSAAQGGASGASPDILNSIVGMISGSEGGLAGLVQKMSSSGLQEQVASWVSTGSNLPVTAEQIQSALGSSALGDIASKLGLNTSSAASSLADLLPQVIDKLTPNGQLPSAGGAGDLLAGLGSLFGGKAL